MRMTRHTLRYGMIYTKYYIQMNDNKLIAEVISFLMDNEQYGDNWEEHIKLLNTLTNEQQ